MPTARCLFISCRDPGQDDRAQELLDSLLVCASFGLPVALLFQGDGLWQLLPGQQADALGRRSLAAQLESLPLFDVDDCYVLAEDLARCGLRREDLVLPCQVLPTTALATLIAESRHVLRG